jgi:FAD/FMN-containing dehydrogenase
MSRWRRGEQTVLYLVDKGRLENFESTDLGEVAAALLQRAARRVQTTAEAALRGGEPTFERFRRTRHSAQYFDPEAAPIMQEDASWAIEKASAALAGVRAVLKDSPPGRFA